MSLPRTLLALIALGLHPYGRAAASVLDYPKLCPNETFMHGQVWPTRSYDNDCVVKTQDSAAREGALDINLVVISPYSGAVGDLMTMVEPMLYLAAQEIEDSGLLLGFRLRFHLADSQCSQAEATSATVRAFWTPPKKHGIIGDGCSTACVGENLAARFFNVLQVSPNCYSTVLSVRSDYPYFLRTTPSTHFMVMAGYQVIKLLQWHRIAVASGPQPISTVGMDTLLAFTDSDVSSGDYSWTILSRSLVSSPAAAHQTVDSALRQDARVIVLFAYEDAGAVLFCAAHQAGLSAPEYVFFLGFGWWNQNFMFEQQASAGCSSEAMYRVGYGAVGFDAGGMVTTPGAVHGLSRRMLTDIQDDYMRMCNAFAGGRGACNPIAAGYYYDVLWEYATLLHQFLVGDGRPHSALATPPARQRLFDLGLQMNFQGVTGRVRHFNGVDPATDAYQGSYGDRQGDVAVRQLVALPPLSFRDLGRWSDSRVQWQADILWSPVDATLRVPCASGTCDFAAGWVPPDHNRTCPAGAVWDILLGCAPCPAGRFGDAAATECTLCGVGSYTSAAGASLCTLCPPGASGKLVGALSCKSCDAGSFMRELGGSLCELCQSGTFSEASGATACQACADTFTTATVASRVASDCTCGEGTYLPAFGERCVPCPALFRCPFGSRAANIPNSISTVATSPTDAMRANSSRAYPQVAAGFYTLLKDPFSVYACEMEAFCPGGPPESCAAHHQGIACGKCADHFYRPARSTCAPCRREDALPIILAALLGLTIVLGLMLYTMYDSGDQRLTLVTAVLAMGQLVCTVQALGVMAQLQLRWAEPIATIIRFGSLLALDVDLLKVQCVLGKDSPWQNYLLRLLATPVVALVLALFLQLRATSAARRSGEASPPRRCLLFRLDVNKYLNSLGLLMVLVYVPVTVSMVGPLYCTKHPNGIRSMDSNKAVICWRSEEHRGLMAISIVGLLCFPVALLSKVAVAVLRYPRLVAAGFGPQVLDSHRFLFARFKADNFYWGFFYLLRNLAFAMVPVVCPDSAIWQVTLLTGILLTSLVAEVRLMPWRTPMANVSEIGSMFGLLLFMQVSAFFVPADDGPTISLVASLLLAIFATTVGVILAVSAQALVQYLHRGAPYTIFLCHHKDGAGSLARWFKLRVGLVSRASVFLDSDQLEELDLVVDTVRTNTRNLVVLLTRMTLTRPWCAAEIAAAVKGKVHVVPVTCCDYVDPSQAFLDRLGDLWSPTQLQALAHYSIHLEDIRAGFLHLATLRPVPFLRFAPAEEQQRAVADVLGRCSVLSAGLVAGAGSPEQLARIIIAGASSDAEARSTCEVLRHMVESDTQSVVKVVHSRSDVARHHDAASYLLVVLTRGILADDGFASVALACAQCERVALDIVTTIADTTFAFPAADYFQSLEKANDHRVELAGFLRRVFNVLALPVSPNASAAVMQAQVHELCRRFKQRPSRCFTKGDGAYARRSRERMEEKSVTAKTLAQLALERAAEAVAGGIRPL